MLMTSKTTDTQLHALQHSVNEAREGSETIRVTKVALWNLLQDHYAMVMRLARRGDEPVTPTEEK